MSTEEGFFVSFLFCGPLILTVLIFCIGHPEHSDSPLRLFGIPSHQVSIKKKVSFATLRSSTTAAFHDFSTVRTPLRCVATVASLVQSMERFFISSIGLRISGTVCGRYDVNIKLLVDTCENS